MRWDLQTNPCARQPAKATEEGTERRRRGDTATAGLVIEVISPGSAICDRNTKADTYGAPGVRELWIIDEQSRAVEVRSQTGNGFGPDAVYHKGQHSVSAIFPDLNLLVERIFA